jgi:hypothetical protein
MAKKNNNNLYLIILIVLIGVYLLGKYVINVEQESNFDMNIIKVDTSKIATLNIINPKNNDAIKIYKENGKWQIKQANNKSLADENSVQNILKTIADLKIQNVVARNDKKWKENKLTDSLATEVQIFDGNDQLIKDLFIGRFVYKQNNTNPYQNGRNNGTGLTYIRLAKGEESFIIEGFIPMTFNRKFDDFRNQNVVKLDKDKIEKVSFNYPVDTGFIINKLDSLVYLINQKDTANTSKIMSYFRSLSSFRVSQFDDSFNASSSSTLFSVEIIGKEMNPIDMKVYEKDNDYYIINSSQYPNTNFLSKKVNLEKELLKSNQYFN